MLRCEQATPRTTSAIRALFDAISPLNLLFLGGETPPCADAGDANDDGGVNITDGIHILNFLFLGGPDPFPPGPDTCGVDPTLDDLDPCLQTSC